MLLNTQVWPQMMCELADRKSLRISAQDTDFKVKVFLIVVSDCMLIRISVLVLSAANTLINSYTKVANVVF